MKQSGLIDRNGGSVPFISSRSHPESGPTTAMPVRIAN